MTTTIQETFKRARSRCVPIIGIETPDPAASVSWLLKAEAERMNGKVKEEGMPAVVLWDCMQGLTGKTETGEALAQELQTEMPLLNPSEMLSKAPTMPKKTILILSNAQRFIQNETVMQGVWNCRDTFAKTQKTLILFGPSLKLPAELTQDAIVLTEELPGEAELGKIAETTVKNAKLDPAEVIKDAKPIIDTLRGLSSFTAEQVTALALTKSGYDLEQLWARKVKQIEQTDGLSVYRGKEKYADIGGLDNGKKIVGDTVAGKMQITCLVLIDELDKAMAASQSDSSGTTQDQNKVLLSYMQDNDIAGALFLGPPGTGKTALCKGTSGEFNLPLIMLDLGAMKGSLVGQSEERMRNAIRIIHAVSGGRALFIGACNRTENLPPELRRRFNYLSMFFDLPDKMERASAWKIWKAKHQVTQEQADDVNDDGYTGAEIKNCCLKAWAMDCKLSEAAKTIVPISKSASEIVQALRKSASNKYVSASAPGLYKYSETISSNERSLAL